MKKKIGILTFHASHNYGSMLQAYALSSALEELGHDVQIINFRSIPQKMMYAKPYKYWDIQNIKGRLLSPSFFIKNIVKWKKFESFMKEEMSLTREINYYVGIREMILENDYDAVITGSDQIWNLNCVDFSVGYLLPFKLPCKKIAYAPSMGQLRCLQMEDVELLFKETLSDYTLLSAREKSTAEELSHWLNKPVETMPDPAWLLPVEKYNDISYEKPLVKGKYLFYYSPHNEYEKSSVVYKYARKYGLKAVCSNATSLPCPGFLNYNNAGPEEFLNLIKNADMVCGSSMHMIIFSLLFHKPFLSIQNDQDTRITDLLKIFGLENRIVSEDTILAEHNMLEIDWSKVDAIIKGLRLHGVDYLENALNS